MLVSCIVISYNTRGHVLPCLRSIFAQTKDTSIEVIVLDNASQDGSATAIADGFTNQVQLIQSTKNLGFAAGVNAASSYASGKYILLLNPDTLILDRAIDKLVAFAELNPDPGIWGGRTLFPDGSVNPACCSSRDTLRGLAFHALGFSALFPQTAFFNPSDLVNWDRSGDREVDIVSGCFLLIRTDLWNRLEGFDSAFFMYGEDDDLCLRARAFGARPQIFGGATIVHVGGASEPVLADKLCRLLAAKVLLLDRHMVGPYARWTSKKLLALWPLSRLVAYWASHFAWPPHLHKYEVWRQVWADRTLWWNGRFRREPTK